MLGGYTETSLGHIARVNLTEGCKLSAARVSGSALEKHLLGLSVTLVISVSDAATSRRASCDSVRGRPARDGVPPTPPPRGPSNRSVCNRWHRMRTGVLCSKIH